MLDNCFFPNTGLRVDKPYTMNKVEVDTRINGNVELPIYVYAGNGLNSEYFDDYCIDMLTKSGYNADEFVTIDLSSQKMIFLLCLPEMCMKFQELIDSIYEQALQRYNNSMYYIIEFDSIKDTEECLRHMTYKKREVKYDDKRKKLYIKMRDDDGVVPFEFGSISMVPDIRYNVLKDISSVITGA